MPPDAVVFQHDGIVTLGCNIHDGMLAYIVVVDTDVFAKTNDDGRVDLAVDDSASSYEVSIWSPRIRDAEGHLVQTVSGDASSELTFTLQKNYARRMLTDQIPWLGTNTSNAVGLGRDFGSDIPTADDLGIHSPERCGWQRHHSLIVYESTGAIFFDQQRAIDVDEITKLS